MRLRNATEDLDFDGALAARADRREGRRLPRLARNVKMYQYRAVASYTDQVARYFDAFGRENVHVVIFDDFVRDPAASYRATLQFLGVDREFKPDFEVVNAHAMNISPALAMLVRDPMVARRLKRVLPEMLHKGGGWTLEAHWALEPTARRPAAHGGLDKGAFAGGTCPGDSTLEHASRSGSHNRVVSLPREVDAPVSAGLRHVAERLHFTSA